MDARMRYCEAWKGMALYTLQDGYFGPTWNPLNDDGDALRLAHKLGLLSDVPVWPKTLEETRRAIVREAAALMRPNNEVRGGALAPSQRNEVE